MDASMHAELGSSREEVVALLNLGKKAGGRGKDRQADRQHATYQLFLLCSPQELLGRVADTGVCGVMVDGEREGRVGGRSGKHRSVNGGRDKHSYTSTSHTLKKHTYQGSAR
jgi:hypothetical protein